MIFDKLLTNNFFDKRYVFYYNINVTYISFMGLKKWLNTEVVLEERQVTTKGSQIAIWTVILSVVWILRYNNLITFSWEDPIKVKPSADSIIQESFGKRMLKGIQNLEQYQNSTVISFQEDTQKWEAQFILTTLQGVMYNVKCQKYPKEKCILSSG